MRGDTVIRSAQGRGATFDRNAVRSFQEEDCQNCGLVFYLPGDWLRHRQKVGGSFYCPGCQSRWTYTDPENVRLKRQLERERKQSAESIRFHSERAERAENRERAQKAAKTRLKNRIGAGVCPCCKRSFSALREHMAAKHPNYRKETS